MRDLQILKNFIQKGDALISKTESAYSIRETEAQRSEGTCPRPHCWFLAKARLKSMFIFSSNSVCLYVCLEARYFDETR